MLVVRVSAECRRYVVCTKWNSCFHLKSILWRLSGNDYWERNNPIHCVSYKLEYYYYYYYYFPSSTASWWLELFVSYTSDSILQLKLCNHKDNNIMLSFYSTSVMFACQVYLMTSHLVIWFSLLLVYTRYHHGVFVPSHRWSSSTREMLKACHQPFRRQTPAPTAWCCQSGTRPELFEEAIIFGIRNVHGFGYA